MDRDAAAAAGEAGRVGEGVEHRADLQAVAAGLEDRGEDPQVAGERRVVGPDPLDLVEQQQAAVAELRRPGGHGPGGVGQVRDQEAGEQQVRRAGRQGRAGDVVDHELGGGQPPPGQRQERGGAVQAGHCDTRPVFAAPLPLDLKTGLVVAGIRPGKRDTDG